MRNMPIIAIIRNMPEEKASIEDAGAEKLVRAAVGWSDATAGTKEYGQILLDKLAQL